MKPPPDVEVDAHDENEEEEEHPAEEHHEEEQEENQEENQEEEASDNAHQHEEFHEVEDSEHGTHAAPNYYFADYSYDRENPPFRHITVADWDDSHDKIVAQLPGISLRSCQYKSDDHSLLFAHKCRQEDTKLIAYNSAHFDRTWCDTTIPAGKAVEVDQFCVEPVHLFAEGNPPIDGEGMPPIIVSAEQQVKGKLKDIECEIPCQFEESMAGVDRYIQGTEWKVIQTMNDPMKDSSAKVERTAFRQDVYYSTTSFKSSVPLSHFSFEEYDIFTPAVDFDKVKASGSYMVSDHCASHFTKRNRWADAVSSNIPVANYGKCAHNTEMPSGKNLQSAADRIAVMKESRFNLAFEFGDAKDHITPTVWEAFASGTLPVVLGANNIKDHFPPGSFLAASGFQHWGDLGVLVAKVANDKAEWEKYHTWRSDPEAKRVFEERYNFTRTSGDCRLCRWAYAKRYGMGWSHKQQIVKPTAIDRTLCLDKKENLVFTPFKESWHKVTNGEYAVILEGGEKGPCSESTSSLTMTKDVKVKRVVSNHDHVVDLELADMVKEAPGSDIVLRLEIPIRNAEGSYFPNPHALVHTSRGAITSSLAVQDLKSKVIVLASWRTKITSTNEGVVEVVVRRGDENLPHEEDETRRIRVIIEDLQELSDKATEFYPSTFAKQMVQDFVDPLELFYVDQ